MLCKSLVKDSQMIDAHYNRWVNFCYREVARKFIIPRLNNGNQVALTLVTDTAIASSTQTNAYFLPYDFSKTIAFFDSTGRSLDPIKSSDVRAFGEFNTFGGFAQFFEQNLASFNALVDPGSATTISISNRGTTVTASGAIFTSAHVGQWLLPLARNTSASAGNPENYSYLIASTAGTVLSPSTACVLTRPFRGVTSDSGSTGDLTTGYFQIRPVNTPIIRIWGDPGATGYTPYIEYQRTPSKLANPEDVPEDPRVAEALVHMVIAKAGFAYRDSFMSQNAAHLIADSLSDFKTVKDWDKELIHNFLTANPQCRSYSQTAGRHMGQSGGISYRGIRY